MLFRSSASLSAASLPESERELAERSAYTPWHPRHPTYGFTIPPPSARERRPLVDERGTACAWGAAMGLGDTAASEPRTPRRRAVSFRHEAKRYKSPPRHTSRGASPVRGRVAHDVLEREAAAEEEHVERMRGHAKVVAPPPPPDTSGWDLEVELWRHALMECRAIQELGAAAPPPLHHAPLHDGPLHDPLASEAARKALAAHLEAAPPRSARPRSASPARTPRTPREVVSAVFDAETNAALAELRRLGRP